MNRAQWISKKNQLCNMIKKVSELHGGDDTEWLRKYCQDILEQYPGDEIEKAILCFTDLIDQFKYVPHRTEKK